jgi:hypothetical protein
MLSDLVERCFFRSDCWRKLINFCGSSVVCDERPSEAKQWTAGGEEGIRAVYLTIRFTGVTCDGRELSKPVLLLPTWTGMN